MTPDHFETIVDGSRAPLSAAYEHNPLNPKTVTVFLDASPSGRKRAAHAWGGLPTFAVEHISALIRVAEGASNCDQFP